MSFFWDNKVRPRGIYFHIPFCSRKCFYCDFSSFVASNSLVLRYMNAMRNELSSFFSGLDCDLPIRVETLYFGGGTPNFVELYQLQSFIEFLSDYIELDAVREFTVEVNPSVSSPDYLSGLASCGVSRISVGVQSISQEILAKMNRFQLFDDAVSMISGALELFGNVSADLILGLPGGSLNTVLDTVDRLVALGVLHLSSYMLTVYEKTPLFDMIKKGLIVIPDDDLVLKQYRALRSALLQYGFIDYEISNFAIEGFESQHNLLYWNRKPYLSFGLSSVSFDGTTRVKRTSNLREYVDYFSEKKVQSVDDMMERSIYTIEPVASAEEVVTEELFLGLRQPRVGVDMDFLLASFEKTELIEKKINFLELSGFVKKIRRDRKTFVTVTEKGITLVDEIVAQLLSVF